MKKTSEFRILSLPADLESFFKQLTTTDQKELRFWCHLINKDYNHNDQLRLLTFLEERRDDYEGAVKGCLLSLLGGLYIFTNSPHKNLRRGVSILQMAADLHNSYAIYALGYMYHLNKNYTKAKPLYELARTLNNPLAMNNLGIMHQEGLGIPVNVIEAALLYRESWKLSYTQAQLNLQVLGSNHPDNYPLQYHLYMALTPGDIEFLLKKSPLKISQCVVEDPLLNELEKHSFFCAEQVKRYTNSSLLRDKMLHFTQMTLPTNPEYLYEFGKQFEKNKNYEQAIFYYEKAAIKHHASSQYSLALIFLEGPEKIRDNRKAKILLEKAVVLGSLTALYKLGFMHHHGKGVNQNFKEAMSFYFRAEVGLEPKAMCGLGVMHYFGQGTPIDHNKAVIFFRRSWKLSCPDAKQNLEKMRDRHDSLFIQYHCVMALRPEEIHALFKKSQEVGYFIIDDPLLTEDEKGELFLQFYYGYSPPKIQRSPSFFSQEVDDDILELMSNNPYLFA